MLSGVVLAGGMGTRLGELTRAVNKHLLPVGPWPMVYHPLKKLIGLGVRDIMLVTGKEHLGDFSRLLGSGKGLGCRLTYRVQEEAGGIGQALGLASRFCVGSRVLVILGDNIFHDNLENFVEDADKKPTFAWVALKKVDDPRRYGVAEIQHEQIVGIEEKPKAPKSDLAVTGIYLYPPEVFDVIPKVKPNVRGEVEITDVNRHFVNVDRIGYSFLRNWWIDAGTPESLQHANHTVVQ